MNANTVRGDYVGGTSGGPPCKKQKMNNNQANLPDIRTILQTFRQSGASMCKDAITPVKLHPNECDVQHHPTCLGDSNDTYHGNLEHGDECTLASTTSSNHLDRLENHGSECETKV